MDRPREMTISTIKNKADFKVSLVFSKEIDPVTQTALLVGINQVCADLGLNFMTAGLSFSIIEPAPGVMEATHEAVRQILKIPEQS